MRTVAQWARPALIAAVLLSIVGAACGRLQPAFGRQQATARARQEAAQSEPELGIIEARIDRVTAEPLTLAEADRRMGGGRGPAGYPPGIDERSPVWRVSVQGYFLYEGMPVPGGAYPVYEAEERCFVYSAQSGEELGGGMPHSRPAAVAIYAAVVRDLAQKLLPAGQPTWPVVFIRPRLVANLHPGQEAPDGGPAPEELVAALQGLAARVEMADLDRAVLPDLRTRDGGILVTLGPVEFAADGTATLAAEYHLNGMNGAGYGYRLQHEGGGWRVIEAAISWVS